MWVGSVVKLKLLEVLCVLQGGVMAEKDSRLLSYSLW
jgi:hypothetical protein